MDKDVERAIRILLDASGEAVHRGDAHSLAALDSAAGALRSALQACETIPIKIVHSAAGARGLAGDRPFRAPRHTCGMLAMVTEVARATGGVLFLERIDEFGRMSLLQALGLIHTMVVRDNNPHAPEVFATVGPDVFERSAPEGFHFESWV